MENGTLKKGQIAASPLKADVGDSIEHVKFSYEQVKGWIENAECNYFLWVKCQELHVIILL